MSAHVRFAVPDVVAVFAVVSITQYDEDFNLQIPYGHIYPRSLKIQSRSLKLYFETGFSPPYYFETGFSPPYYFPFVSVFSSKPKRILMYKKIVHRCSSKQVFLKILQNSIRRPWNEETE